MTINNFLGLLLAALVFPSLWVLDSLGHLTLSPEIIGLTIALETLIVNFYFRKRPPLS